MIDVASILSAIKAKDLVITPGGETGFVFEIIGPYAHVIVDNNWKKRKYLLLSKLKLLKAESEHEKAKT